MKNDKVISLQEFKLLQEIEDQTGLNELNSNVKEALQQAFQTAVAIDNINIGIAADRLKQGLEPNPCFNAVCPEWRAEPGRLNFCSDEFNCHGCRYQIRDELPMSFDYMDYMPTHQEALDLLEHNGLLRGPMHEMIEEAQKYETTKARTWPDRMNTEIKGISMAVLQECVNNAFNDILERPVPGTCDPIEYEILESWAPRIASLSVVEMEKAMGIFPNLKLR